MGAFITTSQGNQGPPYLMIMIINIDIDSPYQTYTLAAAKVFFCPSFLAFFLALFLQAGKHFGKTTSSIRDTLVRNDRRSL